MQIINIKGNTSYIKGGTNSGIYVFKDNKALIIDPGLSGLRPKKIIELLKSKEIDLKYIINTHEHDDHYIACDEFKRHYSGAQILSSSYAKLYIENPELFTKYIMGGKENKFLKDKLKTKELNNIKIDNVLKEGILKLNGEYFKVVDFKGHTPGSIGILTKDKILFVGDALVGKSILEKYDLLFLYDIKEELDTLKKISKLDFDYLVPSHSKDIISKEESYELIKKHEQAIKKYINQIRKQLIKPIGLEKLLENIIVNNNLSCNYKEYHFFKSSLVSIISYLIDLGEVEYLLSEGKLLYYTQKK